MIALLAAFGDSFRFTLSRYLCAANSSIYAKNCFVQEGAP
jgi:hypothetical protein